MRLDRVGDGFRAGACAFCGTFFGPLACTFDSTGLDVTSTPAADTGGVSTGGGTGSVPTTTVNTVTEGTTDPTTTDPTTTDPTTQGASFSTTDVDTTGMTTGSAATGETTIETGGSSSSGGPGPVCGDGIVDPGEACDDGDTDETLCTAACKLPTCDDQALGGDETDIDCGGSCPDCANGQLCGTNDDCFGNCGGGACVDFKSCLDLKANVPAAASDVYLIDPDQGGPEMPFAVYCDQVTEGGGWTMVLKVDGRLPTFVYAAPLWADANTFNVDPAPNRVETKLKSFSTVPLTELLVGIETPIAAQGALSLKFVKLSAPAMHAQALFVGDKYLASALGRPAWKAWVPNSSLQAHCDREGLNVTATSMAPQNFARVRIGIVANENRPGDCASPNSYIGVGGGGTGVCVPNAITTTGNRAGCFGDNGDKDIPGFAVVFVR